MSEESGQKEAADGPNQIFQDGLLEQMVGKWKVSGRMGRQPIDHKCDVRWVLSHQFLQLHFLDVSPTDPENRHPKYEAMVFIRRHNMSERYVAHWIDILGGRFSETLGYGTRRRDSSIMLLFEYLEAPSTTPSPGTERMERGRLRLFRNTPVESRPNF